MANRNVGRHAVILSLAAAMMATPALASPGSGNIASEVVATGDLDEVVNYNHNRIKLQTKGPADVRVQKLTFPAGAFTGWHHHPGVAIVTVISGSITTVDHNCQKKTYGPSLPNGSVFVEGHETPMEARSATGGSLYVTYIAPSASPYEFRKEDAVVQNCPRP